MTDINYIEEMVVIKDKQGKQWTADKVSQEMCVCVCVCVCETRENVSLRILTQKNFKVWNSNLVSIVIE